MIGNFRFRYRFRPKFQFRYHSIFQCWFRYALSFGFDFTVCYVFRFRYRCALSFSFDFSVCYVFRFRYRLRLNRNFGISILVSIQVSVDHYLEGTFFWVNRCYNPNLKVYQSPLVRFYLLFNSTSLSNIILQNFVTIL